MRKLLSRIGAVTFAVVAATGGLVAAAQADPVESGTLTFAGDPGDYVTGGASYDFAVSAGDDFSVSGDGSSVVQLWVEHGTALWSISFDAPAGEALVPGTTYTATRFPHNDDGAGFNLSGDHRGCNTLTATFTVHEAVFGPYGYVEKFDASFEQHCEGAAAAARGEVHLANPPTAPGLVITAGADSGSVTPAGDAVVTGTVTCTLPARIFLRGQLFQDPFVRAELSTDVDCVPGAPVPWTATAVPWTSTTFHPGSARLDLRASAKDPNYDEVVVIDSTTGVPLTG